MKTDQQTGGKKLVRKPQYIQKKPGKWAELTFKRFMGDGTRPIEWRKLASGLQAKFAVKGEVRGYVDKDLKERRIDAGQHREYMRRIEQFEDNLNLAIQERYGFSQPL